MKKAVGILITIIAIFGGCYIGIVTLLIQPIMTMAKAWDNDMLTASILAPAIIKLLLAGPVGGIIGWIGIVVGAIIARN